VEKLPTECKAVVDLRLEGRTLLEIAVTTNLSVKDVRGIWGKMVQIIRSHVEDRD